MLSHCGCHVDTMKPFRVWPASQEVPQRGLFVDGLSREYVTCAADVMAVIRAGDVTKGSMDVVTSADSNLDGIHWYTVYITTPSILG